MKIPLWLLQAMINIAKSSGAKDHWVIDLPDTGDARRFLLTDPALVEPVDLASAA